jgi:heme oxygenase (mycobilin-producing)
MENKNRLFVAISKFAVANGMTQEVKEAFVARPHLVDSADGFVRLDVLSPVEAPNEIWLLTYWQNEESFRTWHKSHMYRDSHKGIPKGLKLDPNATEIRFFEHIAS